MAPITMRLTDYVNLDIEVRQTGEGGFGLVYMGPNRRLGNAPVGQWYALAYWQGQ